MDGVVHDGEAARVSVFDHALLTGDGVFETLRVYDRVPFATRRHLDRLARSAAGMGLPVPDENLLRSAMDEWSGDLGNGHPKATGGSLVPGEFDALLAGLATAR